MGPLYSTCFCIPFFIPYVFQGVQDLCPRAVWGTGGRTGGMSSDAMFPTAGYLSSNEDS